MGIFKTVLRKVMRTAGAVLPPKFGNGVNVMEHVVSDAQGHSIKLEDRYRGKVLMVVNVASKCGFTPQYEALEKLHERYRDQGFAVVAFPCNDFGAQEPGSMQEIQEFCRLNYKAQFDLMGKVTVAGDSAPSLYLALTAPENGSLGGAIKWNFTKFIVGKDGRVKARLEPPTPPDVASAVKLIESELKTGRA